MGGGKGAETFCYRIGLFSVFYQSIFKHICPSDGRKSDKVEKYFF